MTGAIKSLKEDFIRSIKRNVPGEKYNVIFVEKLLEVKIGNNIKINLILRNFKL